MDVEVQGTCEERFSGLRDELAAQLGSGEELGASVVVDLDDSFVRKTKMRLELLYPGQHLVALSDRLEKGHEVQLTIPLSPAQILSPGRVLAAVQGAA